MADSIDRLMTVCDAQTTKQFLLGAIQIATWAIEERRAGRLVGSLDDARRQFKQYDHHLLAHAALVPLKK